MRRVSGKNSKRRKTEDAAASDVEENNEENGNDNDENQEEPEEAKQAAAEEPEEAADEAESEADASPKKSPKKKGKAAKKAGGKKAAKSKKAAVKEEEAEDEEFEVESVVGMRYMRGKRQFKVRWRGHGPEEDSWCGEGDLHCPELIQEYMDSNKSGDEEGESSAGKRGKKRKSAAKGKNESDDDEEKEYEVEKVLEVKFKKQGKREFLIRWKGFPASADTWEPEENLNCTDLINKLMAKVEKAKESSDHELRAKPKQTARLALVDPKSRTSRRQKGSRTTYHEFLE